MDPATQHQVTRLLMAWKAGDRGALDAVMPLVESELRRLAAGYMRNERPGHTLQPTALINEAWLRLSRDQPAVEGRSHFVAIAARCMRQILVEHARRKNARKRGTGEKIAALDGLEFAAPERPASLIALDDGLNELARMEARPAQVIELHYFGGLTFEEIADYLSVGRSTVIRDLRMAQVWLRDYVSP